MEASMATKIYIPPPMDLEFKPGPPRLEEEPGARRVLEIGPGKGEFLLHLAANQPSTQFIGIEVRRGRFEKIAAKAERLDLSNLTMIRGDARECLPRLFHPGIFDQVYVLFPDPWPKKRHSKHRLLKSSLIRQLWEYLKEDGEVFSATDAGFYSDEICVAFAEAGGFKREAIDSLYPTYFETKWKNLGREIQYWKFKKHKLDLKDKIKAPEELGCIS